MNLKILKAPFFALFIVCSSFLHAQTGDQAELDSLRKPTYNTLDSIWTVGNNYSSRLKRTNDSITKKYLENQLRDIQRISDSLNRELCMLDIEFAKQHLSSPLSLEILVVRFRRPEGSEFYDVIDSIFRNMPEGLRNSPYGKTFGENLSYFKSSAVGQQAPVFEVKDINANPLSLNTLRGKYVLIDFWASWCIPCRQDHPFLKQVYEKYNSRGLEIISISSDKDLQKWKAAIQQDGTGHWKHFSSLENNINLEDIYYVIGIPVKVLIDRQGVIIARWLGGAEEQINKEMRKKFEEIFE